MEVFRKMGVLRRRLEKSGEETLPTELPLHSTHSKDHLGDPEESEEEGDEDEEEEEVDDEEEESEFSRSRWPSTTFKCVAGPGPKIKLLRSSLNEKRPRNEVARSNSFRFEKYEREPPTATNMSPKVCVSDDYMTPKDFVNKNILPRLLEEDSSLNHPGNGQNDLINDILKRIAKNNGNDLYLELQYSDPSDSKLYTQPGTDPDDMVYKLYVGDEAYYCRPYKQSREESGSDISTFYEDVVPHHISSDGRCVTIISVSSSHPPPPPIKAPVSRCPTPPNRSISESPTITTSEASSDRGSFTVNSIILNHSSSTCGCASTQSLNHLKTAPNASPSVNAEPLYENLDFHRVKISVPGGGGYRRRLRQQMMLQTPFRQSNNQNRRKMTPPKYHKDDSVSSVDGGGDKKFEKFGYSRNEVWNWLYTEDENGTSIYSVPSKNKQLKKTSVILETPKEEDENQEAEEGNEKTSAKGEVEFSPSEFYSASTRLEHLNLEGFESFVSNTLEKVVAKRRKKKKPIMPKPVRTSKPKPSTISHTPIKKECSGGQGCLSNSHSQNLKCQTCLASGESSCSSALSSLESIRSSSQSSQIYHNNHNSSRINKQLTGSSGQSSVGSESLLASPTKKDSEGGSTLGKPYQTLEIYGTNNLYDIPKLSSVPPAPMSLSAANWIQPNISLDRQEWFHGSITRVEAESVLRLHKEGSYLVRNSESSRQDFSLSLKSSHGFMHMRIQRDPKNPSKYILGQFSKPFDSVPEMIHYYTLNRLPIRGAEHMCLLFPICEQLL